MSTIEFTDRRARSSPTTRALTKAALTGGAAPAVLGCRPWRWRIGTRVLQLCRDDRADLRRADPRGCLSTVGCGAALDHALVELAATGVAVDVTRLPDPDDGQLLAEIRVTGFGLPSADGVRRRQIIALRPTAASAAEDQEVPQDVLGELRQVAVRHGAELWVPDGSAPVAGADPPHARLALVCADADVVPGWLAAGEAMSAVVLHAALRRLVAAPASGPVPAALPPSGASGRPPGYPVAALWMTARRSPTLTARPAPTPQDSVGPGPGRGR